jgi:2-hydroxy-6-oxonona-2,4-dienedioate hydrolase
MVSRQPGGMVNEGGYRAAEDALWRSLGATRDEAMLGLARTATKVRIQSVGQGPPVVFVHGANTSGSSWASLATRLEGFRCLLVDRPGTGLSPALPRPIDVTSLPAFAENLVVDVLDALAIPSAHLVATSFGGYIALRTAAAHPDRIERIVLYSWSAGLPAQRLPAFMRLMAFPGIGQVAAAMPQSRRSIRLVFSGLGHREALEDGRITRYDLDAYLALVRDTDTMRNEVAMGRALIHPRRGLQGMLLAESLLASIRTPTLLLWGENDPFGGAAIARATATRIPGATLELLPDAGHAPWLDDPQLCADATAAFLSASGSPRPAPRTPAGAAGGPSPSSAP